MYYSLYILNIFFKMTSTAEADIAFIVNRSIVIPLLLYV